MSKLLGLIDGRDYKLFQTFGHYIKDSLDEFLIAQYPDLVISCLIKFSIGIEIFLKKKLEEKYPEIIKKNFRIKDWNKKEDKENFLTNDYKELENLSNEKTITFSLAIELFCYVYNEIDIKNDLKNLVDIRNGVFHWETEIETFELSKKMFRLYEWLFMFLETNNGWWLEGELSLLDPMGKKREQFKYLKHYISQENENGFNLQRKILNFKNKYSEYQKIVVNLSGDVIRPSDLITESLYCPVCNYTRLYINEDGEYIVCMKCEFSCTDNEFKSIKPIQQKSFKEIVEEIKNKPA